MKTCPQCGKAYDDETKFCPTDGSTLRVGAGDGIIGSVIADRYHVLRKLGEGGMGQVYLAEHVKMGRMSAIKVMSASLVHDADAVGRFNREAANASRISHPNIAAIYDFGETSDGLIYLAMEFVEGESLTALCEALGALPAPRAAEIARQVASALDAAHERGIVHRDLKPDNIMISRGRDGADLVKVVDFGIAKSAEGAGQKVTRTGLVVGTPEYMSPEQLTGDPLDGRSDLYALALVTFNMLTGTLPFTGQTTQEALLKRLTDPPLTLAQARPDLQWPDALQQVLSKALARSAADRYQHANDFGAALVGSVAGMPTEAPQAAPTRQIATPAAAPSPAPATIAAPIAAQRSARSRLAVPALIAVGLLIIAGGARYLRAHRTHAPAPQASIARSTAGDTTLAASPTSVPAAMPAIVPPLTDSAAAPAPAPTPPPVPPPAPAPVPAQAAASIPHPKHTGPSGTHVAPSTSPGIATTTTSSLPAAPAPAPPPPPPPPPPTAPAPDVASPSEAALSSTADQARAQVDAAGRMIAEGKPGEAIAMARGAMPRLATRDDSVTALYYLAQGMVMRSAKTGEQESRRRACSILTLIGKATSHPKAAEIRSFSLQECK